jgi:lysophospholipase L1-like esterase
VRRRSLRWFSLAAAAALFLALFAARATAQLAPANQWEPAIHAFEAADAIDPPAPGGFVFIGSSSIQKWTSLPRDFPGKNAINRGFGGSRLADSTYFAHRIATKYRPRLIALYAGDNDLFEGHSAEQVFADFKDFVAAVRADLPDEPIAFISIKPSPSRAHLLPAVRAANALIADYARAQKNIAYIDVFTPMLDASGEPRAELFIEDRLHMNRAGYLLWISLIAPELPQP